jgi:hypothetical protein
MMLRLRTSEYAAGIMIEKSPMIALPYPAPESFPAVRSVSPDLANKSAWTSQFLALVYVVVMVQMIGKSLIFSGLALIFS